MPVIPVDRVVKKKIIIGKNGGPRRGEAHGVADTHKKHSTYLCIAPISNSLVSFRSKNVSLLKGASLFAAVGKREFVLPDGDFVPDDRVVPFGLGKRNCLGPIL
jgi:hypothetical protein